MLSLSCTHACMHDRRGGLTLGRKDHHVNFVVLMEFPCTVHMKCMFQLIRFMVCLAGHDYLGPPHPCLPENPVRCRGWYVNFVAIEIKTCSEYFFGLQYLSAYRHVVLGVVSLGSVSHMYYPRSCNWQSSHRSVRTCRIQLRRGKFRLLKPTRLLPDSSRLPDRLSDALPTVNSIWDAV